MIRFTCPNCGREAQVPPALASLPLLCKGCGQRVVPADAPAPAESTSPPPASTRGADAPRSPAAPVAPASPPVPPKPPPSPPGGDDEEDDRPFLIPEPRESAAAPAVVAVTPLPVTKPEPPNGVVPKHAPPVPEVPPTAAPPAPVISERFKKFLPIVADVVAVVFLLVVGGLLGSLLAGKPTREVWRDSGSSVKFPPVDLLMWLAPPVVLVLTYLLLIPRGLSLGGRLKRRQEQ